jgi:hypothetical protein
MDVPRAHQAYLQEAYDHIVRYISSHSSPGMGKISEITQHIFISDLESSLSITQLKEVGINAILYLCENNKTKKALDTYRKKKIDHKFVKISDHPEAPIGAVFEDCYEFIHRHVVAEKRVLIHCAAGVSRSTTVTMYYFLKRYYMTNFHISAKKTKDLLDTKIYFLTGITMMVKDARPCVCPNPGFVRQLLLAEYRFKRGCMIAIQKEYEEKFGKFRKKPKKTEDDSESDDSDSEDTEENLDPARMLEAMIETLLEVPSEEEEPSSSNSRSSKPSGKQPQEETYDKLEDLRELFSG